MEHSRIVTVDKGTSNLYIDYDDSLPITYSKLKIKTDGSVETLASDDLLFKNEFWISTVTIPEEDCYLVLVIKRDGKTIDYVVNRVGEPELKIFYTDSEIIESVEITYEQYSKVGVLLTNGFLTYITEGIFYFSPVNQFESFIRFNGSVSKVLKLPYVIVSVGGSGQIVGDELFLDTGFSTYGFLGNKNSYFDLDSGKWIDDANSIAKASDLAKAVAYSYNLEWDDRASDDHIYKCISYLRTYDEEAGVFRLYAPAITPESNAANFDLITEDELGNMFVKGISMLLTRELETIEEGSVGARIPFKN